MSYVNLSYKPKNTDVVCDFYAEPGKGFSVRKLSEHIAAESSVGTWTHVATMSKRIQNMGAKVFRIKGKNIRIAYPIELFECGNVPQLMSSVGGNIFGMKVLKNLRFVDLHLPKSYVRCFKGPKYGVKGVRKLLKVKKRPLLGTIVKPKLGLNARQHARVAYEAWVGGCDIVKDDENLSSMKFNKFEERIRLTLKMRDKAEKETGETKVYMPNVTAETKEMVRRARFVKAQNGRYMMVDILTVGWSALQTLRDEDLDLVMHAHRAGHAALDRGKHGISMMVLAKLSRLIGVDQLHIGTIIGKMEGGKEVIDIKNWVEGKWFGLRPVFAVCSGGLEPGHIPKLVELLGKDIIIQMGGGIHGHPGGTTKGAMAARQAISALMKNVSLREYAKTHKELNAALEKWKKLQYYK
jgi:ribulose-bisphosphate carboxylase large chain